VTGEMWSRFQDVGLAYWILTDVTRATEKKFFKGNSIQAEATNRVFNSRKKTNSFGGIDLHIPLSPTKCRS